MTSRYSMLIRWSDEDGCFVVYFPEFEQNAAHGDTYDEAARMGREVLDSIIDAYGTNGMTLPEPFKYGGGDVITPPAYESEPLEDDWAEKARDELASLSSSSAKEPAAV